MLDKAELEARPDLGALRLRTFAVKDRACADFPGYKADGSHEDGVVLDMDYWVALPRYELALQTGTISRRAR